MKATEFCYWLQGLFEIHNPTQLNAKQTELVKKHLKMVFIHEKENTQYFDFCKGLNGYLTYSGATTVDATVLQTMKGKLDSMFIHLIVKPQLNYPSYHKQGMQLHSTDTSELIRC
jgi:hypothetical protein